MNPGERSRIRGRIRERDGYTVIEMMLVAIVGAVLLLSIYGFLVTQQRVATIQAAEVDSQQSARAGMDILATELRSLSATGGDILLMDDDSISMRVMRNFGIACAVSYSPTFVTVARNGAWFSSLDSVFVYADGDEDVALDDVWIADQAGTVDTTQTCGTQPAQRIPLPGAAAAFVADSVRVGAPVRSYEHVSIGVGLYGGKQYLGRWGPWSSFLPLVGPIDASSGPALRLDYLDIAGNPTTVPTDVYRIDVMIRAESAVERPNGNPVSDSLNFSVFARN